MRTAMYLATRTTLLGPCLAFLTSSNETSPGALRFASAIACLFQKSFYPYWIEQKIPLPVVTLSEANAAIRFTQHAKSPDLQEHLL
jgi:hypothetical protein